ncbi:MAG: hypothetical protein HY289_13365, partial [Planctomycetes bacterium]|nr:hypothetical protein [Planctomycetota bacterium]
DALWSADIVLLRRVSDRPTPFRGLLHHLTTWNILEFKGRNVSARIRDLDLLVELGLGIDRRLNQERARQKQPSLEPPNVSFWYIANHLGKRFLHDARVRLGEIEEEGPGVWRSQILLRPLFLIDGRTVPVERDSVALHLAGEEAGEIDSALAQVIVEVPGYWETYGPLLKALHPNVWKEATNMARSKGKRGDLDLTPFIEDVGLAKLLALVKVGDVIDTVGVRKVVKELGVERFLANLSAEDRQKLKERLK